MKLTRLKTLGAALLAAILMPVLAACGTSAQGVPDSSGITGGDPADAAMYRGEIEAKESKDGHTQLLLRQAEGTDFGYPTLFVNITGDTRIGSGDSSDTATEIEAFNEGDYVEVFYGAALDGSAADTVDAITLKKLPPAETCLFNGTIVSITPEEDDDGDDQEGSMVIAPLNSGDETVFHYDSSTQFYLNFEELKPGDQLNIYFNGAVALSLPPQAFAIEVRPYHSGV